MDEQASSADVTLMKLVCVFRSRFASGSTHGDIGKSWQNTSTCAKDTAATNEVLRSEQRGDASAHLQGTRNNLSDIYVDAI